jgi:ribosomal protein S18 acetylase RimI-like enzyme
MAVSSAGHTGVFAMATRPDFRRRRLASRLLAAIQSWAASRVDHTLYLQVMTDNTPAQSLYARHGFTFSHPYHYRTR